MWLNSQVDLGEATAKVQGRTAMPAIEPSAPNPSPDKPAATAVAPPKPRAENLLINIVCNVAVPTAILTWMSGDRWLGPKWSLLVALSFPVGYGLYDFIARRRWNFISIIGFASVLLSGGFGLLKVAGLWFAVKDASMRARTPLVTELLYNPQVIDVEKVEKMLAARGAQASFARLLRRSTGLLSLAFFVSAALNFALARHLLRSPPGTAAFNGELAKMHLLSWPVIVLPSLAMMMFVLWRLLHGITALTGLPLDEVFRSPPERRVSRNS
jgi:hypothetical protein